MKEKLTTIKEHIREGNLDIAIAMLTECTQTDTTNDEKAQPYRHTK